MSALATASDCLDRLRSGDVTAADDLRSAMADVDKEHDELKRSVEAMEVALAGVRVPTLKGEA